MKENLLKILGALLENPKGSDRSIAEKAGVSQPTITRARQKLLDNGTIESYQIVPNLAKLGFELLAFSFMEPLEEIEEGENVIWAIKTKHGLLAVSVHRNYSEHFAFCEAHKVKTTFTTPTARYPEIPLSFAKLQI